MKRTAPTLRPAMALALVLMASHATGWCESGVGRSGASASVRIEVIVQPYLRILRNSHPGSVPSSDTGPVTVEQQLTVSTNLQHGFCVDLVQAQPGADRLGWQLLSATGGAQLTRWGEGYRVCGNHNGTYALTLKHQFHLPDPTRDGARPVTPWPLLASLAQP